MLYVQMGAGSAIGCKFGGSKICPATVGQARRLQAPPQSRCGLTEIRPSFRLLEAVWEGQPVDFPTYSFSATQDVDVHLARTRKDKKA